MDNKRVVQGCLAFLDVRLILTRQIFCFVCIFHFHLEELIVYVICYKICIFKLYLKKKLFFVLFIDEILSERVSEFQFSRSNLSTEEKKKDFYRKKSLFLKSFLLCKIMKENCERLY